MQSKLPLTLEWKYRKSYEVIQAYMLKTCLTIKWWRWNSKDKKKILKVQSQDNKIQLLPRENSNSLLFLWSLYSALLRWRKLDNNE
jgi:hypothetical protein